MFTQVRSADRRVAPAENNAHSAVMKAVYVVLEPQYQNALSQAARSVNAQNGPLGIELCGYLIEELRDPDNYAGFQADIAEAAMQGTSPPSGGTVPTAAAPPPEAQEIAILLQQVVI